VADHAFRGMVERRGPAVEPRLVLGETSVATRPGRFDLPGPQAPHLKTHCSRP
jgi:hypothetical protein